MSTVDQHESGTAAAPIDPPSPPAHTSLPNASFMDFSSWRSNASEGSTGGEPASGAAFNVALVLDRAKDPTTLLQKDWAERQQELKALNDNGTLWSSYGADKTKYEADVRQAEPGQSPAGRRRDGQRRLGADRRRRWLGQAGRPHQRLRLRELLRE